MIETRGLEVLMLLRFYLLLGGILFIFSLVSIFTRKKELLLRIITLFVLLTIFYLILWAGFLPFTIFMGILIMISVYELGLYYSIGSMIFAFIIAAGVFTSLILFPHMIIYCIPVFVIISILAFAGSRKVIQSRIYYIFFAGFFLALCGASLSGLYKMKTGTIMILILILQFNDGFGYFFGKIFGKTKPFKTLSPNKSLEGYIAGFISIIAAIIILHTILPLLKGMSIIKSILLIVYMFIAGNMGDLLFSSIKRKHEIKDFSSFLPGHGGILDRFDNFFFTSPLYFLLVSLVVF